MPFSDVFLLVIIFILAIKISYEDIKYGKIKNKWILIGLASGLVIYLILIFLGIFKVLEINWLYFRDLLTNTLISFFVAIGIWHAGFWTAGDAKLFTLLAFLLPLDYYTKAYIKYFPSFSLLYNIFIPIFVYFILRGFLYFLPRFLLRPKETLKKIKEKGRETSQEKKKKGAFGFLGFIAVFFLLMIFQRNLSYFLGQIMIPQILIFIFLLFAFKPIYKFFQKEEKAVYLALILLSIYFIFGLIFYKTNLINDLRSFLNPNFLIFIFAIPFLNKIADFYLKKTEIKKIPLEELTQKMILAESTIEVIKKDKEFFRKIGKLYPDGLEKDQVEEIRNYFKNKKEEQIEISQTFPFAPFIFLGVVITIILRGSIYHILLGR